MFRRSVFFLQCVLAILSEASMASATSRVTASVGMVRLDRSVTNARAVPCLRKVQDALVGATFVAVSLQKRSNLICGVNHEPACSSQ